MVWLPFVWFVFLTPRNYPAVFGLPPKVPSAATGQSFESQDLAQTCFQSPRKCKCQLSNITTCNFIVWLSLVITPNLNSSGNNGVITVSLPWAWSSKTPVPNANRIRSAKAASELSSVILKQDSKCIKFLLELRLKHLQSLNLISTQARLQLHILRFEGRKPLVHLITAHQWTLPHLHEWLLWPRHWVRHWDRWQVTGDRWQVTNGLYRSSQWLRGKFKCNIQKHS